MRFLGMIFAAFLFLIGCSSLSVAPVMNDPKIVYRINSTTGYLPLERVKLECAVKLLNRVVNTVDFQQRVLDASFTEMGGYKNWQILAKMVSGRVVDLNFIMYESKKSNIIAYVYFVVPNKIWMNRKYEYMSELNIAATILHESMHLHGFRHDKKWDTSVPYHIEDLFIESARLAFLYNSYEGECLNEGISDFSYLYPQQGSREVGGEVPVCSGTKFHPGQRP
jgi:hypothetical protein